MNNSVMNNLVIKDGKISKGRRPGQALVDFPNGYTASVIRTESSYGGDAGLFEIAVMYNGVLDYTTPVTNDVLGYLTEQDVVDTCELISALEPKEVPLEIGITKH